MQVRFAAVASVPDGLTDAGASGIHRILAKKSFVKKFALLIAVIVALGYGYTLQQRLADPSPALSSGGADATLQSAYRDRQSNLQVRGEGTVVRILPDDLHGSRHQRFIIKMRSGQTLLIAHNIDLAPRINGLKLGDVVGFYGVYDWNPKGGVIHWTHHDPRGEHIGGWLKYDGHTYR